MDHIDRILGILLLLQRTRSLSAAHLAHHFEVSRRTIYRDLQTLSGLGVPIYTTRGHGGGIHLHEGFFLPPLMFSREEAIALLLALTLLRSLHATPFPKETQTAMHKLLVAVPASIREVLQRAEQLIAFERVPTDIFHPEPAAPEPQTNAYIGESATISTFLQAILDHEMVQIHYRSPYRHSLSSTMTAIPSGLFWDRDHWYLVGYLENDCNRERLWRADRVHSLVRTSAHRSTHAPTTFDIHDHLERSWLKSAMQQWQRNAPVIMRLTRSQAQRLQQDWYYRYATFEEVDDDQVMLTIGEENPSIVFELLRWLGPGAELLAPQAWREQIKEELCQMLAVYDQ